MHILTKQFPKATPISWVYVTDGVFRRKGLSLFTWGTFLLLRHYQSHLYCLLER